jgi:hypothetical protein
MFSALSEEYDISIFRVEKGKDLPDYTTSSPTPEDSNLYRHCQEKFKSPTELRLLCTATFRVRNLSF